MFLGRVPAEGEPYWLDEDRDYALAWQAEKRSDHGCGESGTECLDLANSFAYEYEVVRCHNLYAKNAALSAYLESHPDEKGSTLLRMTRNPHGRIERR